MSTCSQCGTSYPNNVRFCTRDGTVLEDAVSTETEHVGKVLAGKYKLDAYLSKGGMGSVFRATHLMLEKQVALKVIKPELVGSSEFVRRFQREARAATSLNHPNIVGVYDLGQTDDGALYIAMEFVDGASLKDVIRTSGPMDPIRIVRIMRQILSALALAHRHQIVHRDLKPQNIMLTTDRDGNEIAKLVDFGIAKTFDDRTQLTATGFAIGTPQYMAPEQAAGTEVDGRSDLYSLGIILYEMLVAEVPFNDPSTPAILVKHLTEIPVRPSLRRTDVSVHRGLEDVAVRCLEKDRSKRFQTAEEVAQAIAAAVALDENAASVSQAATLLTGAPQLSTASTRTAAPAAVAPLPASVAHPAEMPGPPAGTVTPPAASVVSPVAVVETPPAVAAPAAFQRDAQPAPVVKTGRNSLALGVGALAIVALAGMGFAVQRFVGGSGSGSPITLSTSSTGVRSKPVQPAAPNAASPPASTTASPAVTPASSATDASSRDAPKPTDTLIAPPPQNAAAVASRETVAVGPPASTSTAGQGTSGSGDRTPASTSALRAQRETTADPRRNSRQTAKSSTVDAARERVSPTASAERARTGASDATPAAVAPISPQLAEHPTVLLRCEGAPEVCGAVRDAFGPALDRERMPITSSAPRADVYIIVNATALEGRVEQQFGTTFAVRTYAITVELEAPKMESAPTAPQSRTFSADLSVGRERVAEQARLVAMDTVQRIREFWTRRRAAGN